MRLEDQHSGTLAAPDKLLRLFERCLFDPDAGGCLWIAAHHVRPWLARKACQAVGVGQAQGAEKMRMESCAESRRGPSRPCRCLTHGGLRIGVTAIQVDQRNAQPVVGFLTKAFT